MSDLKTQQITKSEVLLSAVVNKTLQLIEQTGKTENSKKIP